MACRIVAIGQPAAGDDGVGLAVARALLDAGLPAGAELIAIRAPVELVPLLETPRRAILVDAVVGARPGRLLVAGVERLADGALVPVSTHGLGLLQAIELARTLHAERMAPSVVVLGVAIARPDGPREGLSPELTAAVPRAAALLRSLADDEEETMHEASLARLLLRVALERAAADGARRIRTVRGWIAEAEALSPRSLELHFSAWATGTAAEGARLELELRRVEARCGACGGTFAPDHHLLLCPSCGGTEGTLLGATGLGVDALEVE